MGKDINVTMYGENSTREFRSGCEYGIHAEMDILKKLINRKLKHRYFNLLVIRIDRGKILKNSKPCQKCIAYMNYVNQNSPYNIKYVYYSTEQGIIIKQKLSDLTADPYQHLTKRFRSKR